MAVTVLTIITLTAIMINSDVLPSINRVRH